MAGNAPGFRSSEFRLTAKRALFSVAWPRHAMKRQLRRGGWLAEQPRATVAMEACGGAHHWGRKIGGLGHAVRLTPPVYVKPYVKRQKNDAADAEAICEAASRPTMRFVAVKTEEQSPQIALAHLR